MSETNNNAAPEQAAPPTGGHTPAEQLIAAVAPAAPQIIQAILEALERTTHHTGRLTASLLALIIISMSALAGLAISANHVDTAEKIVIALVSFLGGAAMFSGQPKK